MMKNNIRICKYCKKYFELNKNKGNKGYICSTCRTKLVRKRLKQKAVEYLGGKCKICGYNKCLKALDFHHINPKEKEFNISYFINAKSWETIKEELDKCILLCANCHRELHYKNSIAIEEYQKYIQSKDNIQLKSQEKKDNKNIYFKNLQEKDSKNNINLKTYLSSRYYKRKVKRPETYEQFKQEMDELNWNYSAMGRKYGVSDNAIRKWEKAYQKYGI